MTPIGAGGVAIAAVAPSKRYAREYRKLAAELQARVDEKIALTSRPAPHPPAVRQRQHRNWT